MFIASASWAVFLPCLSNRLSLSLDFVRNCQFICLAPSSTTALRLLHSCVFLLLEFLRTHPDVADNFKAIQY